MSNDTLASGENCNCYAVRAAARHVTQYYDQFLAPTGLRISQFGILTRLKRLGPLTIASLRRKWRWIARRSGATYYRSSVTA